MREFLAAVLALLSMSYATATHAQSMAETDTMASCLGPVRELVVARGGNVSATPERFFMREGESRSFPATFTDASCMAFLALGQREVRDVDLFLHTDGGIMLVQDVVEDAHPFVRYCGAAGLTVYVTVRMYQGQGEVDLSRIEHSPATLGDLDAILGECVVPVGGMHSETPDLGPAPAPRTLQETLAADRVAFLASSYIAIGQTRTGTVDVGDDAMLPISLARGACYAGIVAVEEAVGNAEVAVLSATREPLARGSTHHASSIVRFCLDVPGTPTLVVRTSRGRGAYLAEFLQLNDGAIARPAGITGIARAAYAEVSAAYGKLGFSASQPRWAYLDAGESVSFPFEFRDGVCYMFSSISAEEDAARNPSVLVEDERRNVLSRDLNNDTQPFVFYCAEHAHNGYVTMARASGHGRAMLVVGESTARGTTP